MAASLLLATWALPGRAAEAGAWETFDTLDNTRAWLAYDDSVGLTYYLQFDPVEKVGYFYNEDDYFLYIYTHPLNLAGGGKMIGNYASENIQGVVADVYIDSPADLYSLECAVYTVGPLGEDYYFSLPFLEEDFTEPGWYTLRFGFEFPWVHFGTQGIETVAVDTQFLTNIEELGFYYTPNPGATQDVGLAFDNVKLEPKVVEPAITTSLSGGNFTMSFIPGEGVSCYIEQMLLPPDSGWAVLPEHFDLTGTTPYVFTTPVVGREFFRVNYEPIYTPYVTPPYP